MVFSFPSVLIFSSSGIDPYVLDRTTEYRDRTLSLQKLHNRCSSIYLPVSFLNGKIASSLHLVSQTGALATSVTNLADRKSKRLDICDRLGATNNCSDTVAHTKQLRRDCESTFVACDIRCSCGQAFNECLIVCRTFSSFTSKQRNSTICQTEYSFDVQYLIHYSTR